MRRIFDRLPTDEELAACDVLFEQVEQHRYSRLHELPAGCTVVRFPSLDTNLLWPFDAVNPYDEPAPGRSIGRFPHGDRILLRCVERDWDEDRIVDHYLNGYESYRLDMARLAVLEDARLKARDARADVSMSDTIDIGGPRSLFWSNHHPRKELMGTLVRRVTAAAAGAIPELAGFDPPAEWLERCDGTCSENPVPVHPGVAAELGLPWYDPHATYLQRDGARLTHDEYVREYVRSALAVRARRRGHDAVSRNPATSIRPPLEGAARVVGPTFGIYADGFAGPVMRCVVEAVEAFGELCVELYLPPHHREAATVVCTLGASKAETMIEPGTPSTLTLSAHVAPGARADFMMTCSQTLNLFERGESEDNRDLGVLILKMRAA